jgi:1,2-phenylacetyl-CoA epoxidase catalytic subunit
MSTVEVFLAELDAQNREALERIGTRAAREPSAEVTVAKLLMMALRNEIEATECAAAWIATTPEIEVKLALARQAGDEAKHYRLIQKRLRELGVETDGFDPGPRSALLEYLASLATTVERVAAGQFTREALALVRNEEFVRFCESRGDAETAALYQGTIQPDERHHHELGRALLAKLAVGEAAQEAARQASRRTLALAEELQEIARMKLGVSRAPGC